MVGCCWSSAVQAVVNSAGLSDLGVIVAHPLPRGLTSRLRDARLR
jgi:hypothetical protein